MITFDPENRPGVSGLLSTAAICTGRSEVEIAEEIGMGGSGQLKKYVTEAVNEYFAPIRERRQRYENDLDYVKDVLHEGNALPRQTGTGPPAVSCQRACSRSTPLNRTEGRNANQTQQGRLFHRLLPAPLLNTI